MRELSVGIDGDEIVDDDYHDDDDDDATYELFAWYEPLR